MQKCNKNRLSREKLADKRQVTAQRTEPNRTKPIRSWMNDAGYSPEWSAQRIRIGCNAK